MIEGFFNKDVSIYEKTQWFYSKMSLPTDTVNVEFSEPRHVMVELLGFGSGTGTVTLQGNVQEQVQTLGNGKFITSQPMSRVDSVSTTGLVDESPVGTLKLGYSTSDGQPVEGFRLLGSYKAWVAPQRTRFRLKEEGLIPFYGLSVVMDGEVAVNTGDYLEIDGAKYLVDSVFVARNRDGSAHHVELIINTERKEV
ncbi:MAG: hypothetical protein ACK4WF_07085 [Candidatus Brocadiales bacterium]